ncbi:MAG: hypothetical protein HC927_12290 [Deltaproteobacteria bacterium]|nr:hypothetical protein [Deltaproteobacteria bacterium]
MQQHLRSRGWRLKQDLSAQGFALYERNDVEIDVPLRVDYADYARRLEEVLEILASVEKVSPAELIDDLTQPIGDTLAIRVQSEFTTSGTLPLEDSIRVRQGAKALLLSAAHSAVLPQPWFPRMTRTEAVELMNSVQEGQTQRGSFVARFIVPVEPAVGELDLDEEPFGRRVMTLLFRALEGVRHVRSLGAFKELLGMEKQGVSGNLLAALASMVPRGSGGSVEFGVTWARNRRVPSVNSTVIFPSESLAGLDAVADEMRRRVKTSGFEVIGYVTRLERPEPTADMGGGIALVPTEGETRELKRVSVQLDAASYTNAIEAHKNGTTVRVVGTLQKSGRRWVLADASGFEQIGDGDAQADHAEAL